MNLKMKKTLVRDTFIQALFDYSTAPSPLSLPLSLSSLAYLSLSLCVMYILLPRPHTLTYACIIFSKILMEGKNKTQSLKVVRERE